MHTDNEAALLTLDALKQRYSYPDNSDFSVREVAAKDGQRVFVLYISSIVAGDKVAQDLIRPLQEHGYGHVPSIISLAEVKRAGTLAEAVQGMNNGFAFVLAEGQGEGYLVNVAEFAARGIERSQNESVLKGPKESFTEAVGKNISLIRKGLRSEQLIVEDVPLHSGQQVYMLYMKNIADTDTVNNVRDRVERIDASYVQNIELLEQLLEERPYSLFPSLLYTERPDRAMAHLQEGHVVVMLTASSACLILPVTFWSFFHSGEDHYLRFLHGNLSRFIRYVGLNITLFTSALYISITAFHPEMLPPDLLLAIAATREKVPFPVAVEVIVMEFSFELIREAGLRIPTPLGPTIGIVGALILGQAAVQANIISPIIVIVVALSGLSSFTIADIGLNYSIRILRFLFMFMASFMGLYGVAMALMATLAYMASLKSFDVPFFAPVTPDFRSSKDTLFRKVLRAEKVRPGFLKPKQSRK